MPSEIDLAAFSEHLRRCDVRARWEVAATTTPFSAPGSFAGIWSKSVSASLTPRPLQRAAPLLVTHFKEWLRKAPRRVRRHDQALRARRRALDGGARGGSGRMGAGRHSQLLPGLRGPLRRGNDREADDQPACVLALPGCRRPLPSGSRRCRSRLCPLAARRPAAISGGGSGEPADCGMRRRSHRAPADRAILLLLARLGLRAATWRNSASPTSSGRQARCGCRASRATRSVCRFLRTLGMRSPPTSRTAPRPARATACSCAISRPFGRSGMATASRRW